MRQTLARHGGRVNTAIDAEREALLKVLVDHEEQFVVIGGAGIQSHGRRYDTLDIDLTRDRDEANLHRLADALNELDCRLVTDPANTAAWVPLPPDYFTPRALLAATVWNLATRHGQLGPQLRPKRLPGRLRSHGASRGAPHCRRLISDKRWEELTRREPVVDRSGPLRRSLVFRAKRSRRRRAVMRVGVGKQDHARLIQCPLDLRPQADEPSSSGGPPNPTSLPSGSR
jgi:hypothetical protein